jgi:DNA polymerase III alpha subunit
MLIHLRLHTEFSVVDGNTRMDEAVDALDALTSFALGGT